MDQQSTAPVPTPNVNAMTTLRMVVMAFTFALLGVVVAACVIGPGGQPEDVDNPAVGLIAIAVIGVGALTLAPRVKRQLDCASDRELVSSYSQRLFLRLAIVELPTLLAFAAIFVTGPWWVIFVGLAFSLIGFRRLLPNARNLEREQRDLGAHGCYRSLAGALRMPTGAASGT